MSSTADPQVRGTVEASRLGRQCRTILAMLQVGPCAARELATVALKYTSRISDLRRAGYDVRVTERDRRTGWTLYELVGWRTLPRPPWARLACLILAAAAALAADLPPDRLEVYGLGLSKHWGASGYQEINPGLGLGVACPVSRRVDFVTLALGYQDSYGCTAGLAAVGFRGYLGERDGWHATAAAMGGLLDGSDHKGLIALPIIGAGWNGINVEATTVPGDPVVSAVWLRLSWEVRP